MILYLVMNYVNIVMINIIGVKFVTIIVNLPFVVHIINQYLILKYLCFLLPVSL
jgi:hypothetical protein